MKPYFTAPLFAALTFAATTLAQAAAPSIQLHLAGAIVTGAGSTATARAIDRPVKAGDVLRYTIVARNVGTAPAYQLAPLGRVPAHTEFLKVDAAPAGARVAYTSDGTHWTPGSEPRAIDPVDACNRPGAEPLATFAYRGPG